MKKLLNGVLLCSLVLAPDFASPLSRFQRIFTKDNLALHTNISLDPSVTVKDDGPAFTAATSRAADFAASLPMALPIGDTPEPGSVFLLLAGGVLIVLLRKRYTLSSR
jgi:hypothetical protein